MLKSWKTSLLGVTAFLMTWVPVFHSWATTVKDIPVGPLQILGLITGILGVLSKDHNVSGT